jgi:hypothetical protein
LRLLRRHLFALAFEPDPAPLPLWEAAALLLFHLAALGVTARLAHWPYLVVVAVAAGLTLPQWLRRTFRPETLAPLALVYGLTALRLGVAVYFRASGQTTGGLIVPEPWGTWLSFEWAAGLAALWLLALSLAGSMSPARLRQGLTLGLGLGALGWAAWVYFQMIPGGITGSDPYAYVQMAVDLVKHGTFLHYFPLAQLAFEHHLPVYPTLAVGYHIPAHPGDSSPTVWPPGFSILLAIAYRLLGERGLYATNPVLGLAALGAVFALAAEVWRGQVTRWLAGAVAMAWLATSVEQAGRLAVPLADVAAQALLVGALWLAWRADTEARPGPDPAPAPGQALGLGLISGLLFGLAYFTRYTQVLTGAAFVYLAATGPGGWRRRAIFLGSFGVAAGLVALLSFGYHLLAFGNPLATGSGELGQFSLGAVPGVLVRVGGEMFGVGEWGVAAPFILIGGVSLWRRRRRAAWALLLGFVPPLLFHLPYAFLRLRDLLWLFPVLALLAAAGSLEFFGWLIARRPGWRGAVGRGAAFFVGLGLLAFRWNLTLPLTHSFFTFGSLTAEQRQTLGALADRTPPEAVIAASLNSGAVEFYAQRATVRPGALLQPGLSWTTEEWLQFVDVVRAEKRPLYLLVDSVEMDAPLKAVESRYRTTEIAPPLYLPYYYLGGGSANQLVALYQVNY